MKNVRLRSFPYKSVRGGQVIRFEDDAEAADVVDSALGDYTDDGADAVVNKTEEVKVAPEKSPIEEMPMVKITQAPRGRGRPKKNPEAKEDAENFGPSKK